MSIETNMCTGCGRRLPLSKFKRFHSGRVAKRCLCCNRTRAMATKAARTKYYNKNKARLNAKARAAYAANLEQRKAYNRAHYKASKAAKEAETMAIIKYTFNFDRVMSEMIAVMSVSE